MTTRIGFGVYDGGATRFSDSGEIWVFGDEGTWFIPSRSTQVFVYECGVLTEAEYHRIFGHDLPPLPMYAFCPVALAVGLSHFDLSQRSRRVAAVSVVALLASLHTVDAVSPPY